MGAASAARNAAAKALVSSTRGLHLGDEYAGGGNASNAATGSRRTNLRLDKRTPLWPHGKIGASKRLHLLRQPHAHRRRACDGKTAARLHRWRRRVSQCRAFRQAQRLPVGQPRIHLLDMRRAGDRATEMTLANGSPLR